MLIATSYPLLEIFWTLLVFFGFVIWVWLAIVVFADIFRRHDTSGFAKVLWILFIVILPYLGVFVYLLAEHRGLAERGAKQQRQAQDQLDDYVRSVSGSSDPATQIAKAKELLDSGTINQQEFERMKQQALAG